MLSIGDFARLGEVSPRTLRHYDDMGVLAPVHVDPTTGYRFYSVAQLARLHQIVALRDLGFGLDQIGELLDDDPPLEQLVEMLRSRRSQIAASIGEDRARLRRLDANLRALEAGDPAAARDIVLKRTQPLGLAEIADTAPGYGPENLEPVFARIIPEVMRHLDGIGVRPGIMVGWYEEPFDDGTVVLHAGFDIADQTVESGERVRVVELPVVEVASVVHRGSMDDVVREYVALVQWIDDSGYRLNGRSRELYHEWCGDNVARNVTELQMPVAR
jgi:DNA-binding transcriptional MerR regulator/effector-binding domain-containing protein